MEQRQALQDDGHRADIHVPRAEHRAHLLEAGHFVLIAQL